jgi:hypothetical protein
MLRGFYLTLLAGPVVPSPVPQVVLDALTSVEVTNNDTERSGFQLTFTLSNRSPLHTLFLLSAGAQQPIFRVILVVTANGTPTVLMDGVVTDQQVAPGGSGSTSSLVITGEDLTVVMDKEEFSGLPYPAMPPEGRVALILAKYAMFGIIPKIIPSVLIDTPLPTDRIPVHRGTDLHYVKQLADDVGYVFYVEPGPTPATNVAYWGPQVKVGLPQPALNIDMDAHTNVDSLSFRFDGRSKVQPVVRIQDADSKQVTTIPVPDITPLNPPLGLIPPLSTRFEPIEETAKLSPLRAALVGMARAAQTADAVTGTGKLDVMRYGQILKPRQLVGVRGAGPAFDGLHYVKSVTHNIKRGQYTQSFQLTRNGLISTLPRVAA